MKEYIGYDLCYIWVHKLLLVSNCHQFDMSKFKLIMFEVFICLEITLLSPVYGQDSTKTDFFNQGHNRIGLETIIPQEDFNKGVSLSPWELIQGRLPGISISSDNGEPGTGYTVTNLRNINFMGLSSPFVIVDGMPLYNTPLTINPNDISEFIYIKDGAPAGIYGRLAANGVLIVNTRKASDAMKIHYSSSFSISEVQNRFDIYGTHEYRKVFKRYWGSVDTSGYLGGANTDWQNEVFRTSFGQDHYLSLSGTLVNIPIAFSFGKTIQNGIVKTSKFDRTTVSLSVSPSFLNEHLRFHINANGIISEDHRLFSDAITHTFYANPTMPVYNEDGSYYLGEDFNNPVAELMQSSDVIKTDRLIGNIRMDYRFNSVPQLQFSANIGREFYKTDEKNLLSPDATYGTFQRGSGYYENSGDTLKSKNYDYRLTWSGELKSVDSRLEVIAGFSDYSFRRTGLSQTGNFYPAYSYWGRTIGKSNAKGSFYGSLSFLVKEKYSFLFSLSQNKYSNYINKNTKTIFPSFLLSWNVGKENFFSDLPGISDLRFFVGYGTSGNFIHQSELLRSFSWDDKLKQERISSFNSGVIFGLFGNRVFGTIEYYNKTAKDIIANVFVLSTGGYSMRLINAGETKCYGVELKLNALLFNQGDLKWNFGANVSFEKNEVTDLYRNIEYLSNDEIYPDKLRCSEGESVWSFYAYKQAYDDEGYPIPSTYMDNNGDGTVNEDDQYFIGTPFPKTLLGLNSDIHYRNWSIGFAGRIFLGNYIYNYEKRSANYRTLHYNNCSRLLNEYQIVSALQQSDFYVDNASFFRMDYMSLGYRIKVKNLEKTEFNISAIIQNAFVLTKYQGQDPEVADGVPYFDCPRPRTASLRLSFDF